MKKTYIILLFLVASIATFAANKSFDTSKKYRITCKQYPSGSIVPGQRYESAIPILYKPDSDKELEDTYWILEDAGNGKYAIRNAVTKQYMTFDGIREQATKREMDLTDEIALNDSSYWYFVEQDDYCAVINAAQTTQAFNVRGGSYIVGTYVGTIADNGLFQLFDAEDLLWGKEPEAVEAVFDKYLNGIEIDGGSLVYDSRYKQYMVVAPADLQDGVDYKGILNLYPKDDTKSYSLLLQDTILVNSGDSCLFAEMRGGKSYKIILQEDGISVCYNTVTFTTLPLVEITGYFSTTYAQGLIRVNEYGVPSETLNARLRHRGATASGKAKKAYAVKLYDENWESVDKRYFGLREDNNWILDAMAIDPGRTRNRVSTDIWNAFSVDPYHKAEEPNLINGTRGQYVEVILNGNYHGLYCMTEKVDRKQLKLKKFQEETMNPRGVLYKSSQWSYEVFMGHEMGVHTYPMREARSYSNYSDTWASYEMQYPEVADGEPIDWAPLRDGVNLVAARNRATFMSQVADYFDLPVFLDYYLFVELLLATDNHGKNMFLYNYNKDKYNTLGVAPWDLDGVFGRRWDGSNNLTSNATQNYDQFITSYEHGQYTLYKRLKEYDYNSFSDSLAYRYAELRQTHFSEENLLAYFINYVDAFNRSGASIRELERWAGTDSRISDLDDELDYTCNWISDRLSYLDEKYDIESIYLANDISNTHNNRILSAYTDNGVLVIESSKPTIVRIYSTAGQLLQTHEVEVGLTYIESINKGVYLVNNQKVVLK